MVNVFYPFNEAKKVPLTTLNNGVFTTTGKVKSTADNTARRFCATYKLNYPEFLSLIQKNYEYFSGEYKENNPELTLEEIAYHQKQSFYSSTRNRIAEQYTAQFSTTIDSFTWLASDREHPRDSHMPRYGVLYTKESPPPTLPGEEYNCGCGYGY
jgi:hypothetical protein